MSRRKKASGHATPSVGDDFQHRGHVYQVAAVEYDDQLGFDVVTLARKKGMHKGDGKHRTLTYTDKDGEEQQRTVYDGSLKSVSGALADVVFDDALGVYCFKGCSEPRSDGQVGIAQYDMPGSNGNTRRGTKPTARKRTRRA